MRIFVAALVVLHVVVFVAAKPSSNIPEHGGVFQSRERVKHVHQDGHELPVKFNMKVHSPTLGTTFLELGSETDVESQGWWNDFTSWLGSLFNSGDTPTGNNKKQCEGQVTITEPTTITDGSGANTYEHGLDCKWLIKAPSGKKAITLTIEKFDLEKDHDFLYLYSVPTGTDEPLFTLTGEVAPGKTFTSETGEMLVEFTTDATEAHQGFAAKVSFAGTSDDVESPADDDVGPEDDGGSDSGSDSGPAKIVEAEVDLRATHVAHKTDRYRTKDEVVVLRRGFPMTMKVSTDNPTECGKLSVWGGLHDGQNTFLSGKTDMSASGWTVSCKGTSNTAFDLTITPADLAAVGLFQLYVKLDGQEFVYDKYVAVIFNPWNKKSPEFWPNDASLLDEYVLSENIGLWRGSAGRNSPMRWALDQFEPAVFYSALDLLQGLDNQKRQQIQFVVRHLSSAENGMLHGKWARDEKDYDPYTKPWEWTGSGRIFAQWRDSSSTVRRRDSVRYAQCWVFSGAFTSLMRTLGMPSRSVTNFESAHEHQPYDNNCDAYWVLKADGSDDYTRDRDLENDSVWNFHVWNEVFFTREDCEKCDGWQSTDATPQEYSDGDYQLGPAPKTRVYNLDVSGYDKVGYDIVSDTHFLVSEVNADQRHFLEKKSGSGRNKKFKLHYTEKNIIGKEISCNKPLRPTGRDDVTDEYKPDERNSGRVLREWATDDSFLNEELEKNDVTLKQDFPTSLDTGSSFHIGFEVELKESVKDDRRVELYVEGQMVDYTGQPVTAGQDASIFKTVRQFVHLKDGERSGKIKVDVAPSEYTPWLGSGTFMQWSVSGSVIETGQRFLDYKNVEIVTPPIDLVLKQQDVKIGSLVDGAAVLVNPLVIPITNLKGQIHLSGHKVDLDTEVSEVDAFGRLIVPFALMPNVAGKQDVIISFTCDQVTEFQGSAEITVEGQQGESLDAVATQADTDAKVEEQEQKQEEAAAQAEKLGEALKPQEEQQEGEKPAPPRQVEDLETGQKEGQQVPEPQKPQEPQQEPEPQKPDAEQQQGDDETGQKEEQQVPEPQKPQEPQEPQQEPEPQPEPQKPDDEQQQGDDEKQSDDVAVDNDFQKEDEQQALTP